MSSIIRATTTSGLQVAPDNSGSLQLQTNGTTAAVTIDTSQNVGIGTTTISTGYTNGNGALTLQNAKSIAFNNSSNTWNTSTTGGAITYWTDNNLYIDAKDSTSNILFRVNNATERMRIDSSGYVTNAVNGLSSGLHQAQLYYRLNSGYAGSNATGAQSLFGVGVTLVGSTVYEIEAMFILNKSAGTTSHTISLGFGGTATLNNILYFATGLGTASALPVTGGPAAGADMINTASQTVATGPITTAAFSLAFIIKGTVSVNAGGTFIPQYSLSAAPGGAYTTQIGSYIKISPLSASGANTNIGSWA